MKFVYMVITTLETDDPDGKISIDAHVNVTLPARLTSRIDYTFRIGDVSSIHLDDLLEMIVLATK